MSDFKPYKAQLQKARTALDDAIILVYDLNKCEEVGYADACINLIKGHLDDIKRDVLEVVHEISKKQNLVIAEVSKSKVDSILSKS